MLFCSAGYKKQVFISIYFTYGSILRSILSLTYPASCMPNKRYVSITAVEVAPDICKHVIIFFIKRGYNTVLFISGNVPDFVFTLEKTKKIGTYNV